MSVIRGFLSLSHRNLSLLPGSPKMEIGIITQGVKHFHEGKGRCTENHLTNVKTCRAVQKANSLDWVRLRISSSLLPLFSSLTWNCFPMPGSLVLHCLSPSAIRALQMICYQGKVPLLWINNAVNTPLGCKYFGAGACLFCMLPK